jgi:hypothetical protein
LADRAVEARAFVERRHSAGTFARAVEAVYEEALG